MASACCGCLALMDAGVPVTDVVAGISVGVIREGTGEKAKFHLLTDILGEEDGFGDMDFKVIGTEVGITAIQLDIKIEGLPLKVISDTLQRAKEARLKILEVMKKELPQHRKELSKYAPRLLTLKIDPEKIGKVIGPSGKTIRKIQEETGARIDIDDGGIVYLSSSTPGAAEKARDIVEAMTQQVQVGRIYKGEVVSVKDFGAFVEIAPETDGLLHVSEISANYVERVSDHLKVGQTLDVKVILIDDQGRIKLSRRKALEETGEEDTIGVPRTKREGDEGDRGGDRGGERGGNGGRGGRGRSRREPDNGGDKPAEPVAANGGEDADDQPRRRRRRGGDDD